MRTRTSAHRRGSAACGRCADLPVRIDLGSGAGCGRGRPRTAGVRRVGGARTSRSALILAAGPRTRTSANRRGSACGRCADLPVRIPWQRGRMRTRTSAYRRGSAGAGCADLPVRIGLAAGPDADEDVRTPPRVWRVGGARTSRSALILAAGPEPRTSAHRPGFAGARTSRSALILAAGPDAEDVRAPPGFGGCGVRGPPGPHCWQRGRMRTRTSAYRRGSAGAGCADLPVRVGLAPPGFGGCGAGCGRGRPRTA